MNLGGELKHDESDATAVAIYHAFHRAERLMFAEGEPNVYHVDTLRETPFGFNFNS